MIVAKAMLYTTNIYYYYILLYITNIEYCLCVNPAQYSMMLSVKHSVLLACCSASLVYGNSHTVLHYLHYHPVSAAVSKLNYLAVCMALIHCSIFVMASFSVACTRVVCSATNQPPP